MTTIFAYALIVTSVFCSLAEASGAWGVTAGLDPSARQWLEAEYQIAFRKVGENISPGDTDPGAVIAARSRKDPPYYFHWVRDAGIVFDNYLANLSDWPEDTQNAILNKAREYTQFSNKIQQLPPQQPATGGLGEAKYNVNGSLYLDSWSRPQNDGPAMRAISLMPLVHALKARGEYDFVRQYLYRAEIPADTVIKRDLEYVSHHWREANYDLWEETWGDHFYTRMVQLRAMVEGAELAREFNDEGAAAWYAEQAREIRRTLDSFWDGGKKHFVPTLNQKGMDYKNSGVDASVIAGLLHGKSADNYIKFSDRRVWSTVDKLIKTFQRIYPINQVSGRPGVAIGRYPEDKYGGSNFDGGNPWPLLTLAIAEIAYESAVELAEEGNMSLATERVAFGDQMVLRVKYHAHTDGSLSEQMDRNSGYMISAPDLTWNYAAVLSVTRARARAARFVP